MAGIPKGTTYLQARDPGGYAYGMTIQRNGHRVRYSWHYTVGALVCFKGKSIPGGTRGVAVSLYPDPVRSRLTVPVSLDGRRWRVAGDKYRLVPPGDPAGVLQYLKPQFRDCLNSVWKG